ncbi:hypothetical protein CEXT_598401 [Caerostris extrusa]|uniref:Uncharacterized protein n=1 Tax=Caerostris extrusa TaxID=172846 RepID=A0AAV4TQJ7_CAEEX|nr:hypothetical protein CEXT_598401 [Caerostris extrusa]
MAKPLSTSDAGFLSKPMDVSCSDFFPRLPQPPQLQARTQTGGEEKKNAPARCARSWTLNHLAHSRETRRGQITRGQRRRR